MPSLTLRPVLVVFGYVAFLLMAQPNLGTTLITASIVGAMLFTAGIPMKSFAPVAGMVATGFVALHAATQGVADRR